MGTRIRPGRRRTAAVLAATALTAMGVMFAPPADAHDVLAHAVMGTFAGRRLPLMSREDLIVSKALAHQEHSPRHWYDALALIAAAELDWPYLLHRARRGPKRVASLLLYAQSKDLPVPDPVGP